MYNPFAYGIAISLVELPYLLFQVSSIYYLLYTIYYILIELYTCTLAISLVELPYLLFQVGWEPPVAFLQCWLESRPSSCKVVPSCTMYGLCIPLALALH